MKEKRCDSVTCPRRVLPEGDDALCRDCLWQFLRALKRARREHAMAWNYRQVRYTLNGESLVGLAEVFYDAAGQPNGYAHASVLHWTNAEELRNTLVLMLAATTLPVIDVAENIIVGIDPKRDELDDETDDGTLTFPDAASRERGVR